MPNQTLPPPQAATRSEVLAWFDALHAADLSTTTTPEFLAAHPAPVQPVEVTDADLADNGSPDYEAHWEQRHGGIRWR